jgi:hypothetical protein
MSFKSLVVDNIPKNQCVMLKKLSTRILEYPVASGGRGCTTNGFTVAAKTESIVNL